MAFKKKLGRDFFKTLRYFPPLRCCIKYLTKIILNWVTTVCHMLPVISTKLMFKKPKLRATIQLQEKKQTRVSS